MKMRKILSFVLVLSLVLGSFSMAFAATPAKTGLSDIAGIANEDAIQVNNDLGIITGMPDGTFLPAKAVNRAEFAAMITRAMAIPESALAGYTATTFKDMTGYGWANGYIAFCQSKGIMIGDGNGNAMPGRTINTNEAMTMVLRAIGYTNNSAELVGTWPANYVTIAQNVGLYDDVAAVASVDRANAAQIIYNALTVQKVSVNTDGDTKFLTVSGTTEAAVLFNTGLGCTKEAAGVLDSSVDSKINLTKYSGMFGSAYTKSGSVVAFVTDSTNVTGEVKTTQTELKAADKTYSFKTVTPTLRVKAVPSFVNGTKQSAATSFGAIIDGTKFVTVNGDISGKTINDIYSISTWDVTDAKKATTADIADISDQQFAGIDFTTNDDDAIDYNSFKLVGVTGIDKIAKDNVVYVYTDNLLSTGKIVKIAVGTKVVTGKVTAYSSADKEFTVNGTVYQTAKDAGVTGDVTKAFVSTDLGKDVELSLDAYGYVYDYKVTSNSTDKYGVIEKYVGTGMTPEVKLFTVADKDSKVFQLTTDGNTDLTATRAGVIVGYAVDKDGKISDAKVGSFNAAATLNGTRSITIGTGAGTTTSYAIDANVVVFTVSTTGTAADVAMSSIDKVNTGALGYVEYKLNDDGDKVVALVVSEGKADKTTDDIYFVINSLTQIYDATEDENLTKIVGFAGGIAVDKTLASGDSATVQTTTIPALWTAKLTSDGFYKTVTTSAINLVSGAAVGTADVQTNGTALKVGANVLNISKDAVVYELVKDGTEFDKYVVSTADRIRDTNTVYLYSTLATTDSDYDGYDIVIFVK